MKRKVLSPKYCPICGSPRKIFDTRYRGEYVWRRSRCQKRPTKHRWTSIEVFVDRRKNVTEVYKATSSGIRREIIGNTMKMLRKQLKELPE